MLPARALRRLARGPRRRLLDAERAFFDAYGRGGTRPPGALVVPAGFFARADVERALHAWLRGAGALDERALEAAWRAEGGRPGDEVGFYRNLAHFVSLV